ncbi:LYR motif-containing protein 5 [Lunasporangiospora selenospora]|uniref:LYR motif-containing protein 5 n=1 Tax=Lunasporangiospora selenospora TaxID=979761 RepID=A0A9P6FWZ0_9FUNG|nr:LYR motif-containing protein 5 [Lunasporangiospora selenospora]
MSQPTRYRAIALYKQVPFVWGLYSKGVSFETEERSGVFGKEYPAGADYFHRKLKVAFVKNKDLTDSTEIQKRLDLGDFVCKEIEAMYHINKYRAMKKRYYEEHTEEDLQAKLEAQNWDGSPSPNLKQ